MSDAKDELTKEDSCNVCDKNPWNQNHDLYSTPNKEQKIIRYLTKKTPRKWAAFIFRPIFDDSVSIYADRALWSLVFHVLM